MTRHVWAEYVEQADENRYTYGVREWYPLRKETIERDFAQAKELHGFRYTQMYGKARMAMKSVLTFACINLKKLAKKRWADRLAALPLRFFCRLYTINPACVSRVCRQSEAMKARMSYDFLAFIALPCSVLLLSL